MREEIPEGFVVCLVHKAKQLERRFLLKTGNNS